jgi:glycosyltransferase involved in cell wall biosynthesis
MLFDTIIDGHHTDYLSHLINYWIQRQPEGELVVVTQIAFEPVFNQLLATAPAGTTIRFIPIPQSEIERIHQQSILRRSFSEWDLCLNYSQQYQPTHILLMYLDIFQLGLWLGRKAPCPVSGIYFRPDFHYTTPVGVKARLNALRKKLTMRGMLRASSVKNLFSLDHSAVTLLSRINPKLNVIPLPDPVSTYPLTSTQVEQLRADLGIKPNRQVLLLFGFLDNRKGIEPLLDALKQVNPDVRSSICLLLVGAIKPDYQAQIEQRIGEVSPEVQIIGKFGEIRGALIQTYFEVSDYTLALYQHHVGMASVIIRSAISGKPLLASNYGYIGRLVQQEQLGAVVDSTSPAAISQLLEKVVTQGVSYSSDNLKKVAEENSDTLFAETIFSRL